MTGFEITLVILILYIIDWIFIIKYIDKPDSFESFMIDFLMSIFIGFFVALIILILYIAINSLCHVNWHSYFTQKLF